MSSPLDPLRCMHLNERRQAQAIADLADESAPLGAGCMAFMQGTSWICKAVGADLEEPLGAALAERAVSWFRTRGVPPVVECTAYTRDESLAVLAQAGFVLAEVEHVLARPVASMDVGLPAGVRIEALDPDDADAMRRHAEIVCSGFVPPGVDVPPSVLESSIRSQRHPNARGFLAIDPTGEPVAASGMEISEIDVGDGRGPTRILALWGTTVLEAFRRQGIQQALIARRLAVGVEQGCEIALIESKPGIPTERNAARVGFDLAYTRLVLKAPRRPA